MLNNIRHDVFLLFFFLFLNRNDPNGDRSIFALKKFSPFSEFIWHVDFLNYKVTLKMTVKIKYDILQNFWINLPKFLIWGNLKFAMELTTIHPKPF